MKMLKTPFYEFLVVMYCLNMHFLQSLLKLKIFIINIPEDLLFIFFFIKCGLHPYMPC